MKPLSEATVAIVGLGLMGGSLALALRTQNACRSILGIDSNSETRALAAAQGISSHVDLRCVGEADIVVLATPVHTIIEHLPQVGALARPGALIMDLGSTKCEVARAMQMLPPQLECIGAHPMCGKEKAGFAAAEPGLFRNAVLALTPLARSTSDALAFGKSLAETIGARPLIVDPVRHDRLVAVTSHLPYAVAVTLVSAALEYEPGDDLLFALAASGFRDTSRLAASDTRMMNDILLTNREAIAEALDVYSRHLAELADRIRAGDEAGLRAILDRAATRRRELFQ